MTCFRSGFLLAALVLSGCAGDDAANGPPMYCPQVAVLQQAAVMTEFLPGRSDAGAEVTTAQVTGVAGACTLQRKKHQLTVTFQAGFAATNGPANQSAPITLPYFVAISDDDDDIIHEDFHTVTLSFDGNASTAEATTKTIKIEMPDERMSRHLQVLVGFQETQDELDYAASHPLEGP